ncbi:MAG: hypothetical protein RJB04_1219 [Verrucomicrobiota bacterium]
MGIGFRADIGNDLVGIQGWDSPAFIENLARVERWDELEFQHLVSPPQHEHARMRSGVGSGHLGRLA